MTKTQFWMVLAVGVSIGLIIGFAIGVTVADQVLVVPLNEGMKT